MYTIAEYDLNGHKMVDLASLKTWRDVQKWLKNNQNKTTMLGATICENEEPLGGWYGKRRAHKAAGISRREFLEALEAENHCVEGVDE